MASDKYTLQKNSDYQEFHLPPELHRIIIDILRADISTNTRSREVSRVTKPHDLHKTTLIRPHEDERRRLHSEFIRNLANWSSTSKFFRQLLAPYVFEKVHLTNEHHSGHSAAALSKNLHGKQVKQLIFKGIADVYPGLVPGSPPYTPVREDIGPRYSDPAKILPPIVCTVLSTLRRFQNLDSISLEFPCNHDGADDLEPDEVVISREQEWAWLALMVQTWSALTQNGNMNLKNLEIIRYGPTQISTYKTPAFRAFLTQFQSFKFSISGTPLISNLTFYKPQMGMLDVYFFDNLVSVTDFALKAPVEGPLGLDGERYLVPLKLKSDQMPNVKKVLLKYIFICPELIDFLVGHQKTLESLSLHKCSAIRSLFVRSGISWSTLFDCLDRAGFENLRHFEVLFTRMPLTYRQNFPDVGGEGDDENASEDERELKQTKEMRFRYENDKNLRIFPYSYLREDSGACFEDYIGNREEFERGEDQASYDRLMHKIKTNYG
ncbi:MAG: hypothetical protein Q9195_008521 [Heterodermia aff. obscurata]